MTAPQEIYDRRDAYEDDAENVRGDYPAAIQTIVTAVRDLAATERERDELRAKVTRVEALHARRSWDWQRDSATFEQTQYPDQCDQCRTSWPCTTARALDAKGA